MVTTKTLTRNLCNSRKRRILLEEELQEAKNNERHSYDHLVSYVQEELRVYFGNHQEIPREEYSIEIRGYNKVSSKPNDVTALVFLGTPDEPDMHDVIGLSDSRPVDVSRKFSDFINKIRPLKTKVLWYCNIDTPKDHLFYRIYEQQIERERKSL